MASGVVEMQRWRPLRRGRLSSGASAGEPMQAIGWIPIALSAAFIVSGLVGRRKGAVALALTAFAGVAAVGAVRGGQLDRMKADSGRQASASRGEPAVARSITIGKTADELRHCWLDPQTLPQVVAGFATLWTSGDGRTHWKVEAPLGRTYEWDSETVDRPGKDIGWRSLPDAAISNEGSLRFDPAPADRGTVATLHFRFNPPGGILGDGLLKLQGTTPLDLVADRALRRFKSLVETGEIPTTGRQPAARADTR